MDTLAESLRYIQAQRQKKSQETRLRTNEINQAMEALDPTKMVEDRNRVYAAELVDRAENMLADAYTFDANGKQKKISNFLVGPELDALEQARIMSAIRDMSVDLAKRKQGEDLYKKELEEYKKNPDKYDKDYWDIWTNRYLTNGELPEGGSFLSVAPIYDVEGFLKDPSFDPRTKAEKEGVPTPEGNYIVYRSQDAKPEQQNTIYSAAAKRQDFAKGLTNEFMQDTGTSYEQKRAYIAGVLSGIEPPQDGKISPEWYSSTQGQKFDLALQKANQIMNDWRDDRKYDPSLINAATYWGYRDKEYQRNIGKGEERRDFNIGLYNAQVNAARKKAEEKPVSLQERSITFAGNEYPNYVDVSNVESTNTTLTGYKLPKDAVKYIEKRDLSTGQIIPIKAKGKTESAIKVTNPIETKTGDDYVVSGWDKNKNVIRLIKKDRAGLTTKEVSERDANGKPIVKQVRDEESYMIPYRTNEYIIEEIVKKLQGKNATARETEELTENYFD